jgi:hypothetical protein
MTNQVKRKYVLTVPPTPPHERILARVDHSDPDACWIWPGATSGKVHKYGHIRVGSRQDGTRRNRGTHIVMWESAHGPVPDGLEIDHLCQVKLCCNPRHLEAVTHLENLERKPVESVMTSVNAMLAARGIYQ